jgi:peptidoglycan LD-endopeptidase CwlK
MTNGWKWTIGISLAAGAAALFFFNRKSIMDFAKEKVWDAITEAKILFLHPAVREKAREFINKAQAQGINLRITSGLRTFDEQNTLYQQGRTTPGAIVTNAKPGYSSHNFGTAIDVVPIVNGNADWDTDWNKIGQIGKSVGFAWGGDWTSFKDRPHFEMNFGKSITEMRNLYNSGQVTNDYINLA